MEIILDKKFFEGFKHNRPDEQQPAFSSFLKFMKGIHKGAVILGNYTSLEELFEHVKENALVEKLFESPMTFLPLPDLNDKIEELDFYNEGSSIKLFFVEKPENKCRELEEKYGYYYFSGKLLGKSWGVQKAFAEKEVGRFFITEKNSIHQELRFDDWGKIGAIKHPLNAIVIVDKYILCNRDNQKVMFNLKQLLIELIPNSQNELPLDITIITEKGESEREEYRRKTPDEKHKIDKTYFQRTHQSLHTSLSNEFPDSEINLSIVVLDRDTQKALKNDGFEIHDRRIITSYYWIESGKGFNLFNDYNQLNASDSKIYYGFNANRENIVDVEHLLEGYSKCVEKSKPENIYKATEDTPFSNRLLERFRNRTMEKVNHPITEDITTLPITT